MAEKKIGLVIANTYKKTQIKLEFAESDAREMKKALEEKPNYEFIFEEPLIDKDPNEVSKQIELTLKKAGQSDTVLIYFSGHGKLDDEGKLCLMFNETEPEYLFSTSLPFESINRLIKKSPCEKIIMLLDCCYSGAADEKGENIEDNLEDAFGSGKIILTSSAKYQKSKESPELRHGIFTNYLLDGLKSEEVADEHGLITIDKLYDYAYKQTKKTNPNQTPLKKGTFKGKIIIGNNPKIIKKITYQKKQSKLIEKGLPTNIYGETMLILNNEREDLPLTNIQSKIKPFLDSLLADKFDTKIYIETFESIKGSQLGTIEEHKTKTVDSHSNESIASVLSDDSFEDKLTKAFLDSKVNKKFSSKNFLSNWFGDKDSALFFLFKKNLKVTNIQFSELLALLRCYTESKRNDEPVRNLQFLSVSEFEDIIKGIIKAFPPDSDSEKITEYYYPLLSKIIVVESFFGSCAVYIPPNLRIDLLSICAKSGYIDSCGSKVFIKDIYEARENDFFDNINNYLKNYSAPNKKLVRFAVYSHEDFTHPHNVKNPKDNINRKERDRNGLDDVKIYVEKYYMGSTELVKVLDNMRTTYNESLMILDPGSYHNMDKQSDNIDRNRTLWLIVDKSIDKGFKLPGDTQYFICYEQRYTNKNPFHFFDEDKPAWIGYTTIPHTLVGAMINITKPRWPNENKIIFGDPFVGTGTSLLEMLKYSNVSIYCSDREKMVRLMVKTNLEFFSSSHAQLKDFEKNLDNKIKTNDKKTEANYRYFMEHTEDFTTLSSKNLFARIRFYLGKRTEKRYSSDNRFGSECADWTTGYNKEMRRLKCQLIELINLRYLEESEGTTEGTIRVFQGVYSKYCSISHDHLDNIFKDILINYSTSHIPLAPETLNQKIIVDIKDIKELKLKDNSCDIIVTDPPDGFNINTPPKELADLYIITIKKMIKALRHNGQLVICLLDRVRTGKGSPFFIHKEFVIQQILAAAEEENREVINLMVKIFPSNEIFQGPYYWESERTLRRAILHFQIKDY